MDDRDRSNPQRRRVSARDDYAQDRPRQRSSAGEGASQRPRRLVPRDDDYQYGTRPSQQPGARRPQQSGARDGYQRSVRSSQEPTYREGAQRTRSSQQPASRDRYQYSTRPAQQDARSSQQPTSRESAQRASRAYQTRSSRDVYRITPREAQGADSQDERPYRQTQRLQPDRARQQHRTDQAACQTSVRRSVSSARADSQRTQVREARRQAAAYRYATPSKKRSKAPIIIGVVAAVVVAAVIGVFAYANIVSSNLHSGVTQDLRAALVETDMANEPFYMLLMGVDGSAERDEDEEFAGGQYRSDSIMLARIDAPSKTVTLVSIHRDTRVDLGEYGIQKINAARAVGGPELAVKTVSKMAGVDISHYAEIDLDAFSAIVDALGGIEVDVPVAIEDWDAGGVLEAGYQTLSGEQALILCRSRNAYADFVGDADQMRSANQRLVLGAIARKLLASDIATIAKTVNNVSTYVTTDLELNDIIGLAQAMQGLDPDTGIYSAMQPADAVYENDIWWCVTDEEEWTKMMDRVKQGLPPTEYTEIDETTGTVLASTGGGEVEKGDKYAWVTIINGTTRDGLASDARATLEEEGFVRIDVDSADNEYFPETLIIYDNPAQVYGANVIAETLGQGRVVLNDGSYYVDGTFLVLIGSDWK